MRKFCPLKHTTSFQDSIKNWFLEDPKDYPWRQTTDPWAILVSEIMLQQTQVTTVLSKNFFSKFLRKFPTVKEMAHASEQEILSAWEGLGYYRRVRNLQQAAITICRDHHSKFPRDYHAILALPGIGKYTAGAVSSFAYNSPQPLVDANVARIFSRLFDYHHRIDTSAGSKQLWLWAELLLDRREPRIYNASLMELGQQICTNKSPQCQQCPLQPFCQTKQPESLPLKKSAKKTVHIDEHAIFCICPEKGILLQQESNTARRAGMWKLPLRSPETTENLPLLRHSSYAITHHKVTLRIYQNHQLTPASTNEKFHPLSTLSTLPMPSPFRKAITVLLEDYI